MADKYPPAIRSRIMSKIHSANTKPEILVRNFLYYNGFRFRKNLKTLPGTPDIVIRKIHTSIFINGCFWHGHEDCKEYRPPKTKIEFWQKKISRNIERDKESIEKLNRLGWNVVVVWECQLKGEKRQPTLNKLLGVLYQILLDEERAKHIFLSSL